MHHLLTYRRVLLWLLIVGTLIFGYGITKVSIDFSFEGFYPKDTEGYQYYQEFKEAFGERQNYQIYVAIQHPEGEVFDAAFIHQVDTIFARLAQLDDVDTLLSPTRIPYLRRRGIGYSQTPYLEMQDGNAAEVARERVLSDSLLVGSFVSRDLRYLCGYLQINPAIFDSKRRDELSQEIRQILEDTAYDFVISGIPYIRTRYVETIGGELLLFMNLSILFIATVLFLTYRNIWGILIPMLAVVTALVWIVGFMGLTHQPVNLLNNLLIPLMFVVGTSDVIHLTTQYLSEVRRGQCRELAMQRTLREIGLAIFLTSLTTAVGFASLLVSRIPPIRSFGIYAALGVVLTYLITLAILPNALLRIPPGAIGGKGALEQHPFWNRFLATIYLLTRKQSRLIIICGVLLLAICGGLILRIPVDTHLIEDIGSRSNIRASMEFFENQSYGMRPFELGLHLKKADASFKDPEVLQEVDRLQNWLAAHAPFSPFLSPVSLLERAHYVAHFNRKKYLTLPVDSADIHNYVETLRFQGNLWDEVVNEDKAIARLSARLPDMGANAFETLMTDFDAYYQQSCDTSLLRYQVTGHAYLTEQNLVYVRKSLLGGLAIAFVAVGMIMGLLFRSWKMLAVSMFPNVIPLMLTGGVMGLFGITLTASTVLVFVISFGVAVDDTIHFLTRYRLERTHGADPETAIRRSIMGTGKAMLITSLILMAGFVMLLASDFGGTFNTGLFTGLTVLFALVADLLLLPILLRWLKL